MVSIVKKNQEESRIKVSIIIPLESHRGLAIECIQRWSDTQTYPRNHYQLIIASPNKLPKSISRKIYNYLKSWDRIEFYEFNDDMYLVAEGAKLADGEFILFTESHCLPEPDALSHLLKIATENPEWAAFSSIVTPIQPNLLAEIESAVYTQHILNNLQKSAFLKVVDQCFLIKRNTYFSTKGFEAEYGGFAEWLLAASLHHAGQKLGSDLTPIIKHYYIGKKRILAKFTLDFSYGQTKFMAECADDPRAAYFPDIPELKIYRERNEADFQQMTQLRVIAFKHLISTQFRKSIHHSHNISFYLIIKDLAKWYFRGRNGIKGDYIYTMISEFLIRQHLNSKIFLKNYHGSYHTYIQWLEKLVQKGRLLYIVNHKITPPIRNLNFPRSNKWSSSIYCYDIEFIGFYGQEQIEDRFFHWSMHCACVYIPLYQGFYQIRLEWEPIRLLKLTDIIQIKFDNQIILATQVGLNSTSLTIRVNSDSKSWHCLSWSIIPFSARDDQRLLGLPLSTINWFAYDKPTQNPAVEYSYLLKNLPIYFLHIPKCAGTSTRLMIENAFSSKAIFQPYSGSYNDSDLIDNENLNFPYNCYRGHFRWVLPTMIGYQDLNTLTILREPLDRIVSLFYYIKQQGRINNQKNLLDFIKNDLEFRQLITSHFTEITDNFSLKGHDKIHDYSLSILPEALSNLSKCKFIGIFESLEDTINLLAWYFGFLPPLLVPRNNQTLSRASIYEIPVETRDLINSLLESDINLYQEAVRLFKISLKNMISHLPKELGKNPDTKTVRLWLRKRYIRRIFEQGQREPAPQKISWLPDDIFHGENLHDREQLNNLRWRWTGPHETTRFFLYLGPAKEWSLAIKLHKATPLNHVESIKLYVNNSEVTVRMDSHMDYYLILARLPLEVTTLHQNGVAEFQIATPVIRGENEFRMLGIALLSIELQVNDYN